MPLDARVGKILIYGALLRLPRARLTLAAAMSLARSPFLSPMDRRQEAQAARQPFCTERSDHMALLRAYDAWVLEMNTYGNGAARRFAERHFLSANGMEELHGMRRTLARSLSDVGFDTNNRSSSDEATSEAHTNIVRALLCAGLYPNIARIRMPDAKFTATAAGAIESVNEEARAVKFFEVGGSRVFLHPSCVLFGESVFEHARWLTFTSKQQVGVSAGGGGGVRRQDIRS